MHEFVIILLGTLRSLILHFIARYFIGYFLPQRLWVIPREQTNLLSRPYHLSENSMLLKRTILTYLFTEI